MSKQPKAIIITGFGINSEEETAHCFEKAGATSEIVHLNDLIQKDKSLSDYQILAFPGGFSYSDDTGSGNALANKIKNNLMDPVLKFAQEDKLIIGLCNGFQMVTLLGLVPATNNQYGKIEATLMHNKTARLECRWVNTKVTSKKCVWTKNIDSLRMPISHGEGNFYTEPTTLKQLTQNDQIVLKYIKPDGSPANQELPYNPNGAMNDIAGICDESGRIFGLMPHPERFNAFTNEDNWTLKKEELIRAGKEIPQEGAGMQIFHNAINYFKS